MDELGLDSKIDEIKHITSKASLEGGELFEMSLNVDDLEHKIVSLTRFAMFSRLGLKGEISTLTSILKGEKGNSETSSLLNLNVSEVVQLNALFDSHSPLQKSMDLAKLGNKMVKIYFDNAHSKAVMRVERCSDTVLNLPEALSRWEFLPVLPPVSELIDLDSIDLKDPYMWQVVDSYEEWKWALESRTIKQRYIQIGGWPYWIQDGEDDKFVARINNEWGDGGSVYLCYDEDSHKFSVSAQTY